MILEQLINYILFCQLSQNFYRYAKIKKKNELIIMVWSSYEFQVTSITSSEFKKIEIKRGKNSGKERNKE